MMSAPLYLKKALMFSINTSSPLLCFAINYIETGGKIKQQRETSDLYFVCYFDLIS